MPSGSGCARCFGQSQQQAHGRHRQHCCQHERSRSTGPRHQCPRECGTGGERGTARQFESPVGRCQRFARHERRHQRGRRDAEAHGADSTRKPSTANQPTLSFDANTIASSTSSETARSPSAQSHQLSPRHAVGEQAHGHRDQQEGRSACTAAEKTDFARPCAECQHGDQRHGRKAQLLGGLRGEVGPREVQEGTGSGVVSVLSVVWVMPLIVRSEGSCRWPFPDARSISAAASASMQAKARARRPPSRNR